MSDINLENLTFEDALAQLENIVRELEGGRIKLDDAVEAYEKASALKKFCEERLKNAELKIEKINILPDGSISTEPLDKTDGE
ncbi:MAG: exodeoxyribonuclease VII small subunit [Alphaproteobacteria bacterium]|nr:exodeoxyribonuclease VII small subunit [Alphaproteobacteria bacterium]